MSSVTVAKALRVWKERGVGGLAQAARKQLLGVMRAYGGLTRQLHFTSNADLLDFGCNLGGGVIRPFQVRGEILGLLDEVCTLNPRRVLEVGTANGGTSFLLSQVSHPDATIVSIDLPGGKFGEGYAIWRAPLYVRFARGQQTIRRRCSGGR
jgi:predicted O-methyltransferase YrrM